MKKSVLLRLLILLLSITITVGSLEVIIMAVNENPQNSYKNEKYELEGLKNPDGSIVRGINYTPLYCYGWFAGIMSETDYRPSVVREELEIIAKLGFNSVRILTPFGSWNNNKEAAEPILENYDDFLLACRETGLTATVILPMDPNDNYKSKNSFTTYIITEMVTRFDQKYDDVIVLWELANEPDLNIFTMDADYGEYQYQTSDEWNNVKKPCLQYSCDLMRELGVTNPISIGAMTSSLYTDWDAENLDVINLHPYQSVEVVDKGFTSVFAERDMNALGYIRPVVFTEIGASSGHHSHPSEIIQYCNENGIAYYVWGFAANSAEQSFQGIMDNDKVLRTGTLPYSMIQNYSKWWPVAAASYDDSPTGIGMNIINSVRAAVDAIDKNPSNLAKTVSESAQVAYNQMSGLAGYWTPDFRELFLLADGSSVAEKSENVLLNSLLSILPYIRTYGTYENDNALGGTLKANYHENMYKHNTARGQTIWRARFTMDKGKDGSKGIFMEYQSNLILRQPLDPSKEYSVSIDLNPSVDSFNGIAFFCGDDYGTTQNALNPGIYFRVSHEESEDSSNNKNSVVQQGNTIQIYTVDKKGTQSYRSMIKLTGDLFDEDGYISLNIKFSGNGTPEYPFKAYVYSGNKQLGEVRIRASLMADDCYNLSLFSDDVGVNYFDNLVLSDDSGNVLLSDTFESGQYDYEFLTYPLGGDKMILNVEMPNNTYFRSLKSYVEKLLGKDIVYEIPTDFSAYICDSLLVCEWNYSGIGESGFEIQRSIDGVTWESYWRSMAGTRSAIIPLFEDDLNDYYYRISPITDKNKTENFTSPVKLKLGDGADGEYLASYTDKNGTVQTIEIVGNGVFRTSDINEIAEEDNGLWIDRYVKKTAYDDSLTNVKTNYIPPSLEEKTDEGKTSTLHIPAIVAGICAGAAAIIAAVFVVKRKKRNKK